MLRMFSGPVLVLDSRTYSVGFSGGCDSISKQLIETIKATDGCQALLSHPFESLKTSNHSSHSVETPSNSDLYFTLCLPSDLNMLAGCFSLFGLLDAMAYRSNYDMRAHPPATTRNNHLQKSQHPSPTLAQLQAQEPASPP